MAHVHRRLIILGSGPAGYSAAVYGARALLRPMLVTGLQLGGQLTITSDVENYPGFSASISGPWLMQEMQKQAERFGAEMVYETIVEADLSRRPFRLVGDGGTTYFADALVIATGAQARWLGLSSEEEYKGFGVSACATCDGFFFRDKEVAVVGGGNTAVEEALYLAQIARKVTVIHRRQNFRAERILQDRLFGDPKVEVLWDSVVTEVLGSGTPPKVDAVRICDISKGKERDLPIDGLFVAIGHSPATSLFAEQLALDEGGYIQVTPGTTNTSIPGVFAAGDVADPVYRQAVTAAGMGCIAALDAERFLAGTLLAEAAA